MTGHSRCKARSICSCRTLDRALINLGAHQKLGVVIWRLLGGEPSPALALPHQFLLRLNVIAHKLSFELSCGMRGGVKIEARPVF